MRIPPAPAKGPGPGTGRRRSRDGASAATTRWRERRPHLFLRRRDAPSVPDPTPSSDDPTPSSDDRAPPSDDRELREAIESTALGFQVDGPEVDRLCDEAAELGVGGVCVPPGQVERARSRSAGGLRIVTVANFPLGHEPPGVVEEAARRAFRAGADVLDTVFPLHTVASADWSRAGALLDALERGSGEGRYRLILETAAWDARTLNRLLDVLRDRGVPAVKTSTGFHPAGGATPEAVRALRTGLPATVEVKASGGIRSPAGARTLLAAGATVLGTSSARKLLRRP